MVEGIIADKHTKHPLEYANIAVLDKDGKPTTKGTTSDYKGRFSLNYDIPYGFVVSYVGYSPLYTEKNKTNVYYLTPKATELGEVIIKGKKEIEKHKELLAYSIIGIVAAGTILYYYNN